MDEAYRLYIEQMSQRLDRHLETPLGRELYEEIRCLMLFAYQAGREGGSKRTKDNPVWVENLVPLLDKLSPLPEDAPGGDAPELGGPLA